MAATYRLGLLTSINARFSTVTTRRICFEVGVKKIVGPQIHHNRVQK